MKVISILKEDYKGIKRGTKGTIVLHYDDQNYELKQIGDEFMICLMWVISIKKIIYESTKDKNGDNKQSLKNLKRIFALQTIHFIISRRNICEKLF